MQSARSCLYLFNKRADDWVRQAKPEGLVVGVFLGVGEGEGVGSNFYPLVGLPGNLKVVSQRQQQQQQVKKTFQQNKIKIK
jgi:hypothetical protein